MNLSLVIPGSVRSKKNHKQIYRAKGRIYFMPSDAYKRWETMARLSIKLITKILPEVITTPVHVRALFYYAGPKPDLQGCFESLADALQGYIWADDGLIESWDGSRLIHDKSNPRTEVEVEIL